MKNKNQDETRLTRLENNEAVLMMYMADELSAEDRTDVAAMLERDAGMRQQLADLQAAEYISHRLIRKADRVAPSISAFAAARNFGDLVRAREAEKVAVETEPPTIARYRWTLYPAAAAALLAIGMVAWFQTATNKMNEPIIQTTSTNYFSARQQLAAWDPWDAPEAAATTSQPDLQLLSFLREDILR